MIPPWVELLTYSTCVDDRYVMVHEDATLPEVPIARIPVDNLSQLGTCTAKLLAYDDGRNSGTWMNRALIVADDEWGQGAQWNETEHTLNSELITEDGELLGKYFVENRTYVDYEELAPHLVDALVDTEDVRYYRHSGIDLRSLLRVLIISSAISSADMFCQISLTQYIIPCLLIVQYDIA